MNSLIELRRPLSVAVVMGLLAELLFPRFGSASIDQFRSLVVFVAVCCGFFAGLPRVIDEVHARTLSRVQTLLLQLACVWMVAATCWFLIQARRVVDGVDLYFFVCHARDRVWHYLPSQEFSYGYFPGIYCFWSTVISSFGQSIAVIQSAIVTLLFLNALLVGMICKQTTESRWAGCIGFSLYIAIATRFEALSGTSEPLATIPFLTGVWWWAQNRKSSMSSWIDSAIFGVAIGLSLFCKQQAGTLSIGAAWLLLSTTSITGTELPFRQRLTLFHQIVSFSVLTILLAVLSEGRGLVPLISGIEFVPSYHSEGTWHGNVYALIRNDESFAMMVMLSLIGCVAVAMRPHLLNWRARAVVGILLTAAAATLVQFKVRGYYHYCLLAIPCVTVAYVTLAAAYLRSCQCWTRRAVGCRVFVTVMVVVPFIFVGQRDVSLQLFRAESPVHISGDVKPWHQAAAIQSDLVMLRQIVKPESETIVIPTRRSVLYFLSDSVCRKGYSFGGFRDHSAFDLEWADYVIVAQSPLDEYDLRDWNSADCDALLDRMKTSGTFNEISGNSLSVYVRRFSK